MVELNEILEKYEYIKKHYSKLLNNFSRINHPLISLIINERRFLKVFDEQLKRLDQLKNLSNLIKKSKNPEDFWSIISEIKIISSLVYNVDEIEIVISDESSPDFKIKQLGVEITIEVKKIIDKFELEKVTFLDKSKNIYMVEDIPTIFNAITSSIKKGQYNQDIPHILIFDCSPGIQEDEFDDILYPQKDKKIPLKNRQGNFLGFAHSTYDGLFYKKNEKEEFLYQMISGIVAVFEGQTTYFDESKKETVTKSPRKIFFGNPNSSKKIPKKVIDSIGFEIYKMV